MKIIFKRMLYHIPCGKALWSRLSQIKLMLLVRRYARRRRILLQRYGQDVLQDVYSMLANQGIQYFCDYGTLLGLCRERGFIKHDDDIDFSVLPGGGNPVEMAKLLSKNGFVFLRAFELNGMITEISFVWKQINVDFFFMFKEGDDYVTFIYERSDGDCNAREWDTLRQVRPKITELVDSKCFGCIAPVPKNWDEVLTKVYGDWNIPRKTGYRNDTSITRLKSKGIMLTYDELINHK